VSPNLRFRHEVYGVIEVRKRNESENRRSEAEADPDLRSQRRGGGGKKPEATTDSVGWERGMIPV